MEYSRCIFKRRCLVPFDKKMYLTYYKSTEFISFHLHQAAALGRTKTSVQRVIELYQPDAVVVD